jgi:hypothetical protein
MDRAFVDASRIERQRPVRPELIVRTSTAPEHYEVRTRTPREIKVNVQLPREVPREFRRSPSFSLRPEKYSNDIALFLPSFMNLID